jgi:hypothetical protein
VVLFLNLNNLVLVVLEESLVLSVEVVAEVITVKDSLELSEELEGVLNVGYNQEVVVDVLLEGGLDAGNINVEFNKVPIEGVVVEVKELVVLLLEEGNVVLEGVDNGGDVLKIVLLKGLELLDGGEKFLKLGDTAAEQVKLAEDLGGVEVKLLRLGNVLKTLLGEFVLLNVGLVQVKTLLEHLDELIWWVELVVPEDGIVDGACLLTSSLLGSGELTDGSEA